MTPKSASSGRFRMCCSREKTETRKPWPSGYRDRKQGISVSNRKLYGLQGGTVKLLIAGGAGYVGSTLIPKLLDRGYKVDVVDLFWFGNYLPRQVGVVNKDIFDLTVEDLHSYDQVIFLAGLSNDPMAEFSPSKNFIFNPAAPAYF